MKKWFICCFSLLISLVIILTSCQVPSPASTKLKVVVSTFPLADFVDNIGREKVEVITLLPAGASPHTYEPTPRQVEEIAKAKVFVKNGLGLEFWLERVVKAVAKPDLIIVDASEGITSLIEEHSHGVNPHVWLDPVLAQQQVRKIAQALIQADPVNCDFYELNMTQYLAELEALDKEIKKITDEFLVREFVAFHAAWTYFAARYGLVEAAVIELAPGKEPSPAHIKEVVDIARKLGIKAIFAESQFNPKAAERIAEEVGVRVLFLDPIGGVGVKDRDSYVKLMMYNVAQMGQVMGR